MFDYNNTASYEHSASAVNVSLATGTGHGGDAEGDTLINIENLTGSGKRLDKNGLIVGHAVRNRVKIFERERQIIRERAVVVNDA